MDKLIEDVELSFKLFEFSVRTMCYAELGKIDTETFGQDLQLNLPEENIAYPVGIFQDSNEVIKASQMAVGAAFGSTAICMDCLLEKYTTNNHDELNVIRSLISAVRNAFSHGMAAPTWYVKAHKYVKLNLDFIGGPQLELELLNGEPFEYTQIGGLALWYRVKDYILARTNAM